MQSSHIVPRQFGTLTAVVHGAAVAAVIFAPP